MIDELLGKGFRTIDLTAKSFRCKKTKFIETDENEIEKQKVKSALEKSPALRQLLKAEMAKKQAVNMEGSPVDNQVAQVKSKRNGGNSGNRNSKFMFL